MSICTRCGKARIVVSSYSEKQLNSTVIYTETVCPDPECQKAVEKGLENEKRKRQMFEDEKAKQLFQRQALKKASL